MRLRPSRTLRQILVKPKNPIPSDQLNGVVYKIPCKNCTKTSVGQSGRSLACRIKEYQQAVHNGDMNTSAVVEHACKHSTTLTAWPAAEVLEFLYPRCILESWHIHRQRDSMNRTITRQSPSIIPLLFVTQPHPHFHACSWMCNTELTFHTLFIYVISSLSLLSHIP